MVNMKYDRVCFIFFFVCDFGEMEFIVVLMINFKFLKFVNCDFEIYIFSLVLMFVIFKF